MDFHNSRALDKKESMLENSSSSFSESIKCFAINGNVDKFCEVWHYEQATNKTALHIFTYIVEAKQYEPMDM
jgi:hypothetical protein